MDIQDIRRARLRKWIDDHYDGNVSAFAKKAGKSQPQIADTLDGRKKFGEKVARAIEKKAGIPPLHLDDTRMNGIREDAALYHGYLLTRAGAQLAAEWEKLPPIERAEVENDVYSRVAKNIRSTRKKPETPHKDID